MFAQVVRLNKLNHFLEGKDIISIDQLSSTLSPSGLSEFFMVYWQDDKKKNETLSKKKLNKTGEKV